MPVQTPVLFLDFDGVLNHIESRRRSPGGWNKLDPACVERVNRIVDRSDCLVVVSSSWRLFERGVSAVERLQGILDEHGFRHKVHDVTPRGSTSVTIHNQSWYAYLGRGLEIQEWIDLNLHQGPICLLDDSCDMAHLIDRLVRTSDRVGLTDEHVEAAVRMLHTPFDRRNWTEADLDHEAAL